MNYQIPNNYLNLYNQNQLIQGKQINNLEKNNNESNVLYDHKWQIIKSIFYATLFYFLTSPNVIEMTADYIPSFIGKRLAHSFLFGLIFLVMNWKN